MNDNLHFPRLLIVGTVPYNRQSTSRAFDAYFHNWPHDRLAQVFSDPADPVKGHCGSLYQITDRRMLHRWFNPDTTVGKIYNYSDLNDEAEAKVSQTNNGIIARLHHFGSRHTPFTHLMRKILWRKKYWNTGQFNKWLENFNPECIFLSFSNDFFILEIALYIAEKFDIPICSSTGDDYYFDNKISLNPLYYLYHEWYKSLNRKVFRHKGSAIYIGNKIRDKYNSAFGLNGETVYLVSDIQRRPFRSIDPNKFTVRYFGNISFGRNNSICDVATAFARIKPDIKIEVYSSERHADRIRPLRSHPNIDFKGCVPYAEVMKKTRESDILLVVEGLRKSDINLTRYALSTKVADSLASGCNIVGYGSSECGAIEYLEQIGCVTIGHSIKDMESSLRAMIYDVGLQRRNYDRAAEIFKTNHTRSESTARVERIVRYLVQNNLQNDKR